MKKYLSGGLMLAGLALLMSVIAITSEVEAASVIQSVELSEEYFPDAAFREELSLYDQDHNGVLSVDEIAQVTTMFLSDENIADLTGLEYLAALENLYLMEPEMKITEINIDDHPSLESISLGQLNYLEKLTILHTDKLKSINTYRNNKLVEVEIAYNYSLEKIGMNSNSSLETVKISNNYSLSEIQLSQNTSLSTLVIDVSSNLEILWITGDSALTVIDIAEHIMLKELHMSDITLDEIDLRAFEELEYLDCSNSVIGCIYLPDTTNELFNFAKSGLQATVEYEEPNEIWLEMQLDDEINNTSVVWNPGSDEEVVINAENFPDETLRNYVSETYDVDSNGVLSIAEIRNVTIFDLNVPELESLEGIDIFYNLTIIAISNSNVEEVDLSFYADLEEFICINGAIKSIDVSNNVELKDLWLGNCNVEFLDISKNTKLEFLELTGTDIIDLDASYNPLLQEVWADESELSTIDVSNCSELKYLFLYGSNISEIDVSECTLLELLSVNDTNLSVLDVSKLTLLESLSVDGTNLTELDVSKNINLTFLSVGGSTFEELDLSHNTALTDLSLRYMELEEIDLAYNTELTSFSITGCIIDDVNLDSNINLTYICIMETELDELDLRSCTKLTSVHMVYDTVIYALYLPDVTEEEVIGYWQYFTGTVYYPAGNAYWLTNKASWSNGESYSYIVWIALGSSSEGTITGDLNGDELIMADDAMLILQVSIGDIGLDDEQMDVADVNKDGYIMADDAMMVLQMSVGMY